MPMIVTQTQVWSPPTVSVDLSLNQWCCSRKSPPRGKRNVWSLQAELPVVWYRIRRAMWASFSGSLLPLLFVLVLHVHLNRVFLSAYHSMSQGVQESGSAVTRQDYTPVRSLIRHRTQALFTCTLSPRGEHDDRQIPRAALLMVVE